MSKNKELRFPVNPMSLPGGHEVAEYRSRRRHHLMTTVRVPIIMGNVPPTHCPRCERALSNPKADSDHGVSFRLPHGYFSSDVDAKRPESLGALLSTLTDPTRLQDPSTLRQCLNRYTAALRVCVGNSLAGKKRDFVTQEQLLAFAAQPEEYWLWLNKNNAITSALPAPRLRHRDHDDAAVMHARDFFLNWQKERMSVGTRNAKNDHRVIDIPITITELFVDTTNFWVHDVAPLELSKPAKFDQVTHSQRSRAMWNVIFRDPTGTEQVADVIDGQKMSIDVQPKTRVVGEAAEDKKGK